MIPSDTIIEKYNQTLPRYTSYPPANFFKITSTEEYISGIKKSNNTNPKNISIYIHIPFCEQLCWYCGCNTFICNSNSKVDEYLQILLKEISNVFTLLDSSRVVTQIHFGGGSPNILTTLQLQQIINKITTKFSISKEAEIAIECNPADISIGYIKDLISIGFNRISLGIQDFNKDVLQAVHRKIPTIPIETFVSEIHSHNVAVNFDFIYGLPLQTIESFEKTILQALSYSPERIVTFSYAHVPGIKLHQKNLEKFTFPTAKEKLEMLTNTYQILEKSNYIPIGLDHFAKKTDSLAKAVESKTLHRNFQGYCTRETTGQVYAFGASAISQFSNSFFQNSKETQEYQDSILSNGFATKQGYILNHDEKITSTIIEHILCNECLDWDLISIETSTPKLELQKMYSWNSDQIQDFAKDGLITMLENGFTVEISGKFFLRNIAAAFDINLKNSTKTFSKTI